MRGHIHKRQHKRRDGRISTLYYAVLFRGLDPATGKKQYDWGRGFKTKREAETALVERLAALGAGTYVAPANTTVEHFLREVWLPSIRGRVKTTTADGYEWVVERYLVPMLGPRRLQDLTTMDLNGLYARLQAGDVPEQARHPGRKNKPLSAKTVKNVHGVLRKALRDAVDCGIVPRNVAESARPPKPTRPQMAAWSASQLAAFLNATSEDRLHDVWHVASSTGMRRGEFLGLRWSDVDLDAHRLSVRRTLVCSKGKVVEDTPKSHEARTVDLDPQTVALLRRHRTRQHEERLMFGEGYARSDFVFTKEDGTFHHPDVVSSAFARAVANTDLPRIRLHDLRHTHATILLKEGVPVKVVSERLGHADPAFTMKTYQHVLPGMQSDAAALFASVIRTASSQKKPRAEADAN